MKKIKTIFLSLALMFGLSLSLPSFAALNNVAFAAPGDALKYIEVVDFEDSANVGSRYYLPSARVVDFNGTDTYSTAAEALSVDVQNPLGEDLTVENDGADYVEVESRGTYTVTYSYTFGGTTYSHAIDFVATEGVYSFQFEENSQNILPSIMNPNFTENVVIPNPAVLNEDGEEVVAADVTIRVINPSSTVLEEGDLTLVGDNYEVAIDEDGVWTVEYLYESAGRVLASTTKEISADSSYNNSYDLTFVYDSTLPQTAVTNVALELPTVTAKNETTENEVEVYYSVTANLKTSTTESVDVTAQVISVNEDGRVEFTADADGDYLITYVVTDLFGNIASSEAFPINDVADTQEPEVMFVNAYTDHTDVDTDFDASYNLPTKAEVDNFVLPAIWATDNVSTELADLTLTRKVVKTNGDVIYEGTTSPNKELVFNYNSATYTLDSNTQEEVLLAEGVTFGAGTYNVTYIAEDEAGNVSTTVTYKVTLEVGFTDIEAPTVSWSDTEAMPVAKRVDDTLTFASPTVEDNENDRNILVVEYFFYNGVEPTENDWTALVAEDGVYTLDIENAQELRVRATATDPYDNSDSITAVIDIIDTNDTEEITVLSFTDAVGNTYVQGNEITLSTVVFEDDYIDFVSFDVTATVETDGGQTVELDAYDAQVAFGTGLSNDTIEISGAKVLASFAGDYTIKFVAQDLQGNRAVYFSTFNVTPYDEQTEIAFDKLPSTLNGGTLELGETLDMPQAELTGPVTATKSYVVRVISGPTGYTINKYEFAPTKVGTYEIEYYGTVDNAGAITNPSQVYTVEVEDTTAPEISTIYVEPVVEVGYSLTIPQFTAEDHSEIDTENSKVVLKSKSYGTKTIYYGDVTTSRVVSLNFNEVYTLTYTVKDIYGNTSTLVKEIKVGDTDAPTIVVDEEDELLVPETANVGDKLTIDLSNVSVYDLKDDTLTNDDIVVSVKLDDEEIENIYGDSTENYQYDLETAGTYTVTLTITDAAGNTSEAITRTIVVSADSNDGAETTEVLGIVLIVVSVLILAGAIVYFVISKRKADEYKG